MLRYMFITYDNGVITTVNQHMKHIDKYGTGTSYHNNKSHNHNHYYNFCTDTYDFEIIK